MLDSGDVELVKHAQQGNVQAAGQLYDQHHKEIFRYIWSRIGNKQQAEDLTGEVFMRMMVHLPGYRITSAPFRAWLYQIARNLITDTHRQASSRPSLPLEYAENVSSDHDPDMMIEHTLAFEKVQLALDKIDPAQREVVEMRFLAGLSLNEVAATLDYSVSAVKSLQHRGLKALRAVLK